MKISAMRAGEDNHWVISVFGDNGNSFGVALKEEKSVEEVNKEFEKWMEWLSK